MIKKIFLCVLFVFLFLFLNVIPSFAQSSLVIDAIEVDDIRFHTAAFNGGFSLNTVERVEVLNLPSSSIEGPDTFRTSGQFTTFGGRSISYHINEGSYVIDYTFDMFADEELYFDGMIYTATDVGGWWGAVAGVKISANIGALTLYQDVSEMRWEYESPYFNQIGIDYNNILELREHSIANIGCQNFYLSNTDPYNHLSNVAFMAVCNEPCRVTISIDYFNANEFRKIETPQLLDGSAFYQLFMNYMLANSPNYSDRVDITQNGIYHIANTIVDVDVPQYNSDKFDFGWLVNIGDSFLGFEFAPGFSIGTILVVCAGLALIMWILKIFMGG